jgi:hypothetical protein
VILSQVLPITIICSLAGAISPTPLISYVGPALIDHLTEHKERGGLIHQYTPIAIFTASEIALTKVGIDPRAVSAIGAVLASPAIRDAFADASCKELDKALVKKIKGLFPKKEDTSKTTPALDLTMTVYTKYSAHTAGVAILGPELGSCVFLIGGKTTFSKAASFAIGAFAYYFTGSSLVASVASIASQKISEYFNSNHS